MYSRFPAVTKDRESEVEIRSGERDVPRPLAPREGRVDEAARVTGLGDDEVPLSVIAAETAVLCERVSRSHGDWH